METRPQVPARHRGTDLRSEYATVLLLPWPLRVQASDFRPVGPVQRLAQHPYGYFEFAPAEGLDLDLLDRVLVAARQEGGSVDVVMLPESAVDEGEVDDLESLLERHGVVNLITGVRQCGQQPGQFPGNWVHVGFNPMLEKGGQLPAEGHTPWFHIRQNKHHRWALDEDQVEQYHLGGALHPHIRWWEAMDDDPGSAVLKLTSYGMVERSRPHGREATRMVGAVEGLRPGRARDPGGARGTRRPAYALHGPRHPL